MPNEFFVNISRFADSQIMLEAMRELRARVEAAGMSWHNGDVTMTSGTDSHRLVYSPSTPRPEEYNLLVEWCLAKVPRFKRGDWVLARLPGEEHYSPCMVVNAADDEKYLVRKDGAEYAVPPEAILSGRCSVCGATSQLHGTLAGKTICLECEKKANA